MPITTDRILLRPPQAGDGPGLNTAIIESLKELHPWMPWARTIPTVDESEDNVRRAQAKWLLREDLRLPIFDKNTESVIGSSGLHRINWEIPLFEIGYWIRTSCVGKGYATEASNALTRFAFEQLKAKRVEIRCSLRNEASATIAKKLGYEFEACLKETDAFALDGPRDTLVFVRFNAEGLPPLEVKW